MGVNSKGEKWKERGTGGSHVRHPEAASAQGVWWPFIKRGERLRGGWG